MDSRVPNSAAIFINYDFEAFCTVNYDATNWRRLAAASNRLSSVRKNVLIRDMRNIGDDLPIEFGKLREMFNS